MGGSYCGLCPGYGDHDTAHHGEGVAVGDVVTVDLDGQPVEVRVLELRGHEARVAVIRHKDVRWVLLRSLTSAVAP